MALKVAASLVLLSIYSHAVSGAYIENTVGCLPSLPCPCPCELGLEYPSGCGICVCPPGCPLCDSACYYPPNTGVSCPTCAPSAYCYGPVGKK